METKPTPAIDMSKVIARANKAPAAGRQPDMTKVRAAVAALSPVPAIKPRPVHLARQPEDAARRKPLIGALARHCSGFNNNSFFNSF